MDELLERLRTQVERATDPIDPSEISRTIRRRRRSRTLNIAAVTTLAAVAVAVVALQSPQREERTSSAPTPGPSNLGLALERIVTPVEPDGTRVALIEFDGELPDGAATYVEDITSVEAPAGLTYTMQDMTETVWVCADRHFGFGPGAAGQHTIDVLIPAAWFEVGATPFPDRFAPPYTPAADGVSGTWAGKILGCGPYKGYMQYSITSVAGVADPADVRVETDGDSIRVVVPPLPNG
ncbi:MAG: hypothetical protein ABIX10_07820 [Acidimicrobiales bacterium]